MFVECNWVKVDSGSLGRSETNENLFLKKKKREQNRKSIKKKKKKKKRKES